MHPADKKEAPQICYTELPTTSGRHAPTHVYDRKDEAMKLREKTSWRVTLFSSVGLLGLAFLVFPRAVPLFSTPQDLVIQVVPAALELGVGESGNAQVVVRNPADQVVSNLKLSWINNNSFEITSQNETIQELPANAEAVWNLEVRQNEQGSDSGRVDLRIDYTWKDSAAAQSNPIPRIQFAEFEVTAPAVEPVANVAGVEVESTLTTLSEQRPGTIYLILENKGGVPLNIKAIDPRVPDFIKVTPLDETTNLTLSSGEKAEIAYQVTVDKTVQPGRYVLLFNIDLAWEKGGRAQVGTLIASHELDVGVFGESQILTLLGIPAFFLLPGFLMIVAFRLLWSRGRTSDEAGRFPLPAASSEFWFVAISLSLLMAMLYPWVTLLVIGARRNYLEAYGLGDVLNFWFGSIFLAVFSYLAYSGTKALLTCRRQEEMAGMTPAAKDGPLDTLRKLARQKLTLKRDRASVNINGREYSTFLLQEKTAGNEDAYWIAPRILITNWEALGDVEPKVYDLLGTGDDIEGFLELSDRLTLAWDHDWPEPGPFRIQKGDVNKFDKPDVMVEFA